MSCITLGTLYFFASQDSPDLYKEYKANQSAKFMEEAIDGSHNDIAKMLKAEYGCEFTCASIESKIFLWCKFYDLIFQMLHSIVKMQQR